MTEEQPEAQDNIDAAAAALQRVRQAALEAGFRPGMTVAQPRRHNSQRTKRTPQPRTVGPQPLGDVFSKFIAQRGWKEPVAVGSVLADWASIVGPQIAENAKVESFENAQLILRATSTAWATQLRLLTPQLMHKFDEVLGAGVITKLEIRGPGSAPAKGRRTKRWR